MTTPIEDALERVESREKARGLGRRDEIKATIRAYILKHGREPDATSISEVFNYMAPGMEAMIREISAEIEKESFPEFGGLR